LENGHPNSHFLSKAKKELPTPALESKKMLFKLRHIKMKIGHIHSPQVWQTKKYYPPSLILSFYCFVFDSELKSKKNTKLMKLMLFFTAFYDM